MRTSFVNGTSSETVLKPDFDSHSSPDEPTFSIRWNDLGSTSRNDFIPLGFESFSHQNARSGSRSLFITVFSNVLVNAVSILV